MKIYLVSSLPGTNASPLVLAKGVKSFLSAPGGFLEESMLLYLAAPGVQPPSIDIASMGRATAAGRLRLLLSYHYFKQHDIDDIIEKYLSDIPELDIFADSGAFSAFTRGETVDVKDYCAWVNRWKHRFTVASAPDIIGNPDVTRDATEEMLATVSGLPVLPVFHVGDSWSYLEHWLKTPGIDYIALGGMVPYTRRAKLLRGWIDKVWTFLPEGMRVHGFGLTNWPFLHRYPWYSVDSSSWTSSVRYARLALFDLRVGAFTVVNMQDRMSLLENARLLGSYGLRSTGTMAANFNRDQIVGAAVRSWQGAETWLNTYKNTRKEARG